MDINVLQLLTALFILTPVYSQSVFQGGNEDRQAYLLWRDWLLKNDAIVHKVPPTVIKTNMTGYTAHDVTVKMTPATIIQVNEASQTIQLSARIQFWWVDPALAVDKELVETFTGGNVTKMPLSVSIPRSKLWLPDIVVIQGADNLFLLKAAEKAVIYQNGTIYIHLPHIFTYTCPFSMVNYPFDEHHCSISIFDTGGNVNIYPDGNSLDKNFSAQFSVSGEWDLIDITSTIIFYKENELNYTSFTLHLRRKTTFYVVMILMPMVLTSYLNLVVFFLPPELGDKASYLVTLMVSLSMFTSFFMVDMPRGLDSIPQIFVLLIFVYVESFLVMVMSLMVLKKYSCEQEAETSSDTSDMMCTRNGRVSLSSLVQKKNKSEGRRVSAAQLDLIFFVVTFLFNSIGMACILDSLTNG